MTGLPTRADVRALLEARGVPMSLLQVVAELGVTREDARRALEGRLSAMSRDGQLARNRRGEYGLAVKMDLLRGRVAAHRDGYGFFEPDGGGDSLFLSPRQMRQLMHGDVILARPAGEDPRGRPEAAVVEVLERGVSSLVGRFWREAGVSFVRPDNSRLTHDVVISDAPHDAEAGQFVEVELTQPPTKRAPPVGRIVDVLGDHMAPGMEIEVAIRAWELPDAFPPEVTKAAEAFGDAVDARKHADRTDIRKLPLVTIDGRDARDYDDAVHAVATRSGWKLTVAIADVASYVEAGDVLDKEAHRRGNSVYFPGRVLPMLPEALSNGLCSLNPKVDRLALVCEMVVGTDGDVRRAKFYEGLMRSHARLTYGEVHQYWTQPDSAAAERLRPFGARLDALHDVFQALNAARERRGALELGSEEVRIVFNAEQRIDRLEPVERNDAHRMIEACMIAANVSAARFLQRHRLPGLYRVHEGPTDSRLESLRLALGGLGYKLGGGTQPRPVDYAATLDAARGKPEESIVGSLLLRSLAQAVYDPRSRGHFGLGLDRYLHFTSPIRRYPDLVVHRAIKHHLRKRPPGELRDVLGDLDRLGDHCSMTERRADEATRDAVARLKCEYMAQRIGERHVGVISGVVGFGVFVTLEETHVTGLLHVSALGSDYFHYEAAHHTLTGDRSGAVFRLGDRLEVEVASVDVDERKVDFELVRALDSSSPRGKRNKDGGESRRREHKSRRKDKAGKGKRSEGAEGRNAEVKARSEKSKSRSEKGNGRGGKTRRDGEARKRSGEARKQSGETTKQSGETRKRSGENSKTNKQSGTNERQSGEHKKSRAAKKKRGSAKPKSAKQAQAKRAKSDKPKAKSKGSRK